MRGTDRWDEHEATIFRFAELVTQAQAIGGALLDHDADEALERTEQVATLARSNDLPEIAGLADDLGRRLLQRRSRPSVRIGPAYNELSLAVDQLMDRL